MLLYDGAVLASKAVVKPPGLVMLSLYYGPSDYLIHQEIHALKQKFARCRHILADELDAANYLFFQNQTLFSGPYLIILANCLINSNSTRYKALLAYARQAHDSQTHYVFCEYGRSKLPRTLVSFFQKYGEVKFFQNLTPAQIIQWMKKQLQAKRVDLSQLDETDWCQTIQSLQADLWQVDHLIAQLTAYGRQKPLTKSFLKLFLRRETETKIFDLVDAVGSRKKKPALRLLHQALMLRTDPWYLLAMFVRQLRLILIYKADQSLSEHPFVVKKIRGQAHAWSLQDGLKYFDDLIELEHAVKQGQGELATGLFNFCLNL